MKTRPDKYYKDIYKVNYKLLKKEGIKVVLFDLDNTLIDKTELILSVKTKKLLDSLKKDFYVAIVSNSVKPLQAYYLKKDYEIDIVTLSFKPLGFGFNRLKKLKNYKPNEICMIGDQIFTDVFGANRRGYTSILVDYISLGISNISILNNYVASRAFKKYNLKRGQYYD